MPGMVSMIFAAVLWTGLCAYALAGSFRLAVRERHAGSFAEARETMFEAGAVLVMWALVPSALVWGPALGKAVYGAIC